MKKVLIGYPLNKYREFEDVLTSLSTKYKVVIRDYDYKWLKENAHLFEVVIPNLRVLIDDDVVKRAENLKLIFTPSTGSDHIKIKKYRKKIKILTLNDFRKEIDSISSTAELAFLLHLALSRKLILAHKDVVVSRNWERNKFVGMQLRNKTLGIVGMGRIGEKVACYGEAFGMKAIYWDKVKRKKWKKISSLNRLLSLSDYILLSISLDDESYHLINMDNIGHIKRGTMLVNISRGKVIEEKALCYALEKGILSGAGVDVLELELENYKSSPLYNYVRKNPKANVIITPHIGGATIDAWKDVFSLVSQKILEGVSK